MGDSNLTERNSFRSKVGEGSQLLGAQNGGGGGVGGDCDEILDGSAVGPDAVAAARRTGTGVLLGDQIPIIYKQFIRYNLMVVCT